MTLLEYIERCPEGEEITVLDNTYDLEVYFYNQVEDAWDEAMMKLASKLNVLEARQDSVIVDLYELIDANIENLENSGLFYDADTDAIMDDMEAILAGNVSENWLNQFVDCLN
jgi:hypothetical protein